MIPGAPAAVAPFSHAVEVGRLVFSMDQIRLIPKTSQDAGDDSEGQTVRVMENLKIVLYGLKLGLENVVCARIYITDFRGQLPAHERRLWGYSSRDRRPART